MTETGSPDLGPQAEVVEEGKRNCENWRLEEEGSKKGGLQDAEILHSFRREVATGDGFHETTFSTHLPVLFSGVRRC